MLDTPVLLVVFNRPDLTRTVLQRLREVRPRRLYVAADGPRSDRAADRADCAGVRALVGEVDWPCEVRTLFRDGNLGCRRAVSGAVDWFFSHEEEGIVVEDDILPDRSFFDYCRELLARHRADLRIMHISGFNVCGRWRDGERTHHISRFGSVWGWASWRRAWRHYDVGIKAWADPGVRRRILGGHFPPALHASRAALYDELHAGRIDTWDYQWTFCRLLHDGVTIVPARNLVRNLGFGAGATHTSIRPRWVTNESYGLTLPLERCAPEVDRLYDEMHLLLSTHNLNLDDCRKLLAGRRPPAAAA